MRFLIVGAGAVGGYVGASLAAAGQEVVLVARGQRAEAIRRNGLTLKRAANEPVIAHPALATDLLELAGQSGAPVFDVIIVTTKSYDLDRVGRQLAQQRAHLFGSDTIVMPLSNGLDAEDQIAAHLGRSRLVGGVVHVAVEMRTPGEILHLTGREISVAPADASGLPCARCVVDQLQKSGLGAELKGDLRKMRWQKLVWNSGFSPLTALSGKSVAQVVSDPLLRVQLVELMKETLAVAAADGLPIPANVVDAYLAIAASMHDVYSSMHRDLSGGKELEIESINGAVCAVGRRYGIPTPINEQLVAQLRAKQPT